MALLIEDGEVGVIDEDAIATLAGEFVDDAEFDQRIDGSADGGRTEREARHHLRHRQDDTLGQEFEHLTDVAGAAAQGIDAGTVGGEGATGGDSAPDGAISR